MAFNSTDIYTSSGSVQLFNQWTPYVSKFDTSTFYNFEQDNLPLYDLEERTYEMWEQGGFPTSANVPGLALTVSADTPALTLEQNSNIFTDLSSCLAALPKVIRFPVLIEVANFGDLGELELNNYRIEEGGSIEIINRAFARTFNASAQAIEIDSAPDENASIALISSVSSTDLSGSISNTQCLHISSLVFSANNNDGFSNDPRADNKSNSVFYPRHSLRKGGLSVGIDQSFFGSEVPERYRINPYEGITNILDETMPTLDISATRQLDNVFMAREDQTIGDNVGGNVYFNKVSRISIRNCDGPIYIRNFFADAGTTGDSAIDVQNSEVVLENTVGARARLAGYRFDNSRVTLSRMSAAYRNYTLSSTTGRTPQTGVGYLINNSDVLVSSLPTATATIGDIGASGEDCVVMASRNAIGFELNNSVLRGGIQRSVLTTPERGSIVGAELNTDYGVLSRNSVIDINGLLDVYANRIGIDATNASFIYENLCVDAQSEEGIVAKASDFIWDSPGTFGAGQTDRKQLDLSGNAQHIVLDRNSYFGLLTQDHMPEVYGNAKFQRSHGIVSGIATEDSLPAISVLGGSFLELIHPNLLVNNANDTDFTRASYGRALEVRGNSQAKLYGSENGANFILGPATQSLQINTAGVYADRNSAVSFHGPTAIAQFGIDVLVENNSVLNIEPPKTDTGAIAIREFDLSSRGNHTSVELHSTRACLVANKNSVINLEDLGSYEDNWIRSSTSSVLDDGVDYDIAAIRPYICSGSLQFYPNPQDDTIISQNGLNDVETGLSLDAPIFTNSLAGVNRLIQNSEIINTSYTNDLTGITLGGVCVRAVADSVVNANNVHFPIGTNTSPLDGKYYDASGSECDKFMIWNMADTSRLNASFLSVSGMHPADVGYHGPSSFWASSVDGISTTNLVPAYGAPALTPDTGSLSILDSFGAGSSVLLVPSGAGYNEPFDRFYAVTGTLGAAEASAVQEAGLNYSGTNTYHWGAPVGTAKNQGPFRIYWSPKPSARLLQTDQSGLLEGAYPHGGSFSGIVGPAYQLFAQGYPVSANVSAVPATGETNASSIAPDLLKLQKNSNTLWTSGFYYVSEMLEENPDQCILDESAARTFANSQNASLGLGGVPKKVTVYRSRGTSDTGSEAFEHTSPGPVGFKSASIFDLPRDN